MPRKEYYLVHPARVALVWLGCAYGAQSLAWEFDAAATLGTAYSDNGARTAENTFSERQDTVQADLSLSDTQLYSDLDLGYQWSYSSFEKDGQENRSFVNGNAAVRLGRERGVFQLLASHNRRRSLIDPAANVVTSNLEERDNFSLSPQLSLPLSRVDFIYLQANNSAIRYSSNSLRDSDQTGVSAGWRRRLSAVSQLDLSYSESEVEYLEFSNFISERSSVELAYSSALRDIEYSVAFGHNTVDSGSDSFGGSTYRFNVTYSGDSIDYGVSGSRQITDNSSGSGADISFVEGDVTDGGFTSPDQYELTSTEFFVVFNGLCARCDLRVAMSQSEESYRRDPLSDEASLRSQATFNYRLSNRATVRLNGSVSDQEFTNVEGRNRSMSALGATYNYQLVQDVSLSVNVENREQSGDDESQGVSETRTGVSVGYRF